MGQLREMADELMGVSVEHDTDAATVTLSVQAGPQARGRIQYQKRGNGTITCKPSNWQDHPYLRADARALDHRVKENVSTWAAEAFLANLCLEADETSRRRHTIAMYDGARRAGEQAQAFISSPEEQDGREPRSMNLAKMATEMIFEHLVDPEAAQLASLIFHRVAGEDWEPRDAQALTMEQYNRVAASAQAMKTLHQSEPRLVEYYAKHMTGSAENAVSMVNQIRQDEILTPEAWAIFARTVPECIPSHDKKVLKGVEYVCEVLAIAALHVPDAPQERLVQAAKQLCVHTRHMKQLQWDHGDNMRAWEHIVCMFLQEEGSLDELGEVAHAFNNAVADNKPWPWNDVWEEMIIRAREDREPYRRARTAQPIA